MWLMALRHELSMPLRIGIDGASIADTTDVLTATEQMA